jgi:ketosteroid isomerase-like protein
MSQENVEVVRRAFDAFNQRDVDEMVRDWDPEVEVDWSRSRGPEAGIYRGQEAVLGLWTTFFAMFDRATVSADEFIECGEHVVVPNRADFRGRDGVRVGAKSVLVTTFRSGRIVKWCLYQERAEAFEAVGLSEEDAAQ